MEKAITLENLQSALAQNKTKIDTKYGGLIPQVAQLDADVTNLSLQTMIGGQLDYANITMSTSPTAAINFIVPFDIIANGQNISVTNGYVDIKKGKTYEIEVDLYCDTTTSYTTYAVFENITNTQISNNAYALSVEHASAGSGTQAKTIFTAKQDCQIYVKVISATAQRIYGPATTFIIKEIGRSTILDPLETKEAHSLEYCDYSSDSNTSVSIAANTSILSVLPIKRGNMPLNIDNTITLKYGKSYHLHFSCPISASGVLTSIIDDLGNTHARSYSGTTNGWKDSEIDTIITPTQDIKIKPCLGTTATIFYYCTRLTIQEIAQPKVVEYNTYKEVSNPLIKDQMQDSPVGTIINYTGKIPPNDYLLCNGAILNIAEYPFLAEKFAETYGFSNYFGGDGVTTFGIPKYDTEIGETIIPKMTSNTTPAPYVASSSASYSASYYPWKAFNGTIVDTSDAWLANKGTHWLQIDLGNPQFVDYVRMAPRTTTETCSPKDFIISASNDGISFTDLATFTEITNWYDYEYITFEIPANAAYRYYRITATTNNGGAYLAIGEMQLCKRNSTKCIKYRPTYTPINQYGGFERKIIFEGNSGTSTTIQTLSDSILNYDFLILVMKWGYYDTDYTNFIIDIPTLKEQIISGPDTRHLLLTQYDAYYLGLTFRGDYKSFYIFNVNLSSGRPQGVVKIIGYKGQLPTLMTSGSF